MALDYQVDQVMMLPVMQADFLRPILLLDSVKQVCTGLDCRPHS